MEEESITLEDVDSNDGQIIRVLVEGKTLIKLKAYHQFLQGELNKKEADAPEIPLAHTIMDIVENELEKSVSFVEKE